MSTGRVLASQPGALHVRELCVGSRVRRQRPVTGTIA